MRGGSKRRKQRLVALCGAGFVVLNFPLLMIWDQQITVFGLPLLPVALFVIWAGLIVALALVSEGDAKFRRKPPGNGGKE